MEFSDLSPLAQQFVFDWLELACNVHELFGFERYRDTRDMLLQELTNIGYLSYVDGWPTLHVPWVVDTREELRAIEQEASISLNYDEIDTYMAGFYPNVARNGHPDICCCPACDPYDYQ
ncbi:MAG: hypothetical protein ABI456_16475 [Ktedonobacteraceae bacterium]